MTRILTSIAALMLLASPALALDPALAERAKDPDSFKRSDAARDLGKDGSPEAAAILRELIADPNPYVRDYAVQACGDLKQKKSIDLLAVAARAREELTRRNCAEALGRTRSSHALPHLERIVTKDRSPLVKAQALDRLWGYEKSGAAHALCVGAFDDKDPIVRAAAVEAAGRIKAEGALDLVRRGLSDEDEGVRIVAHMELRFVAPDEALAALPDLAKASGRRSRAQAVDNALALREAPAIDALIDLLEDDVLSVSGAAHRALKLLTRKEIDRDPEVWRRWWEENRKDWKAPLGRLDELEAGDAGESVVRFHGIEVTSDRLTFVIDVSGSMREALPGDAKGRTRWEAVQAELNETLEKLPKGTRVNLIVFGLKPTMALPAPAGLNRRVLGKISAFAKRTQPGERGNLLGAMLVALAQEDTDTIVLLSDGAPSAGDMTVKGRVRYAIRQLNRMRKFRIHTVGYGSKKDSEKRFMQELARDSGGVCTFR